MRPRHSLALSLLPALLVALAGCAAASAPGRNTARAIRLLHERTAHLKMFSADFIVRMGDGPDPVTTEGKISFLLPDKIILSTLLTGGKGQQVNISDGKVTWAIMSGLEMIAKIDLQKVNQFLKSAGLPQQKPAHNIARPLSVLEPGSVELKGTAKVGDIGCWVFEGRPHPTGARPGKAPGDVARLKVYVGTQDGLARRIVFLDATGKPLMRITYRNVNINPGLSPADFQYTPSQGAAVLDQTDRVISVMKSSLRKD